MKELKICEFCGREFYFYSHKNRGSGKYCSRKCYLDSRIVKIDCENCGKEIELRLGQYNYKKKHNKTGMYCSNCRCSGQKSTRINVTCATCDKIFQRRKRYVDESAKIGRTLYCSKKCKIKWIEWECETCGKVTRKMSKDVPSPHQKRFCSPECANIGMEGKRNPSWRGGYDGYYGPGWKRMRKLARKRDNYCCVDCGISENDLGKQLDVHHIKRFGDFDNTDDANELDNLVCVCHKCHMKREWYDWKLKEGGKVYV